MNEPCVCDVLTFGETMLRFSPPDRHRLEQAPAWDVWVAGSESNVAATLRVFGLTVTWVSRLPDNPLGRTIATRLQSCGIDTTSVVWTPPQERIGTFYYEAAAPPRAAGVVYDRVHSAASFLSSHDLPDILFNTHRHLHVTGITPALSASCADTAADAIQRAKACGRTVSLDVNYRARLWPPDAAQVTLSPLMAQADVLFCSRQDAALLFGLSGSDASCARGLRERYGASQVILTAGVDGAVGCTDAACLTVPAVPVEATLDRLGSGDAFAGAFLAGYLMGASLEHSLRLGVAAAALKRTIPGDILLTTRAEVEALLAQGGKALWR